MFFLCICLSLFVSTVSAQCLAAGVACNVTIDMCCNGMCIANVCVCNTPGAAEICDGIDNNCNTLIDQADPLYVGPECFNCIGGSLVLAPDGTPCTNGTCQSGVCVPLVITGMAWHVLFCSLFLIVFLFFYHSCTR